MTKRSIHWPIRLVVGSQTPIIQTLSHRMRIRSMKTARKMIHNHVRKMRPLGPPLRSSTHARPKGELQGRVLEMICRGRMSTRRVSQVHSLVKPAAKSMAETTTRCNSEKMAYRSKASWLPRRTRRDPTPRAINPRKQTSHHCEVCSPYDPSFLVYGDTRWPPKSCPSS